MLMLLQPKSILNKQRLNAIVTLAIAQIVLVVTTMAMMMTVCLLTLKL